MHSGEYATPNFFVVNLAAFRVSSSGPGGGEGCARSASAHWTRACSRGLTLTTGCRAEHPAASNKPKRRIFTSVIVFSLKVGFDLTVVYCYPFKSTPEC